MSQGLEFENGNGAVVNVTAERLIIAGWSGRDAEAIQHHIDELAELGIPGPSTTPCYYRGAATLLTQQSRIEALGGDSSGEVEPVLIASENGMLVGIGSDHTDRRVESYSIAVSKQLCAKPIGRQVWAFDEVDGHWDQLILRSFAVTDGKRELYQEAAFSAIRPPRELIKLLNGNETLDPGTVMLCGTVPAIGGIRPADRFEMEIEDPVLGRRIEHAYTIDQLPIVT